MSEWMKTRLIVILWPSFLMAGLAEIVFFTLVDPQQLYLLGKPVNFSATATYSIGFMAFWLLSAATAASTLFFMRSSTDINQLPD